MEKIRKAQLIGYRSPKDVEIQVIYQYLRKELGRADKRLRRTAAFLGAHRKNCFLYIRRNADITEFLQT